MLLTDEPRTVSGDLDALIEEARKRTRKRRRRIALLVVTAAAGVAYLLGGGGSATGGRPSHAAGSPVPVTFSDAHFSASGMPIDISLRLAPAGHGDATAYFRYDGGYVIDNGVPGRGARVLVRWDSAPADRAMPGRVMVAIVGPGVAAVRAGGYGTFKAQHVNGLPTAYKAVVFYYPKWPALDSLRARTRQGLKQLIRAQSRTLAQIPWLVPLTPLNAAGKATAPASTRD